MRRYKKVCALCGSEDLHFDASVTWNVREQRYEVSDVWSVYCRKCNCEVYDSEKRIRELNKNTKIL
jgi:alpha-D-ribose 1-methylphosphonate 5-phosphate C-P lyase